MKVLAIIQTEDTRETMVSQKPAYEHELMGQALVDYVKEAVSFADEVKVVASEEAQEAAMGHEGLVLVTWADMPLIDREMYEDMVEAAMQTEENVALGEACVWKCEDFVKGSDDYAALECPEMELAYRVTDRALLAQTQADLKDQINAMHMAGGVTLLDPASTIIEPGVEIGCDTVIYPGCNLQRGTVIGQGCTLLGTCRLKGAKIGNGVTIENSVLLDCQVGDGTTVGPFAYVRPKTVVGEKCRVGDFVELKNSNIGNKTKISHLTYVGDSDLGEDINLGCGVVFVNYDGKTKKRSVVEDHAFIGCNTNLVAPVHVGKDAYVAAGSTITEDVPEGAFYIARSRGTIKEGWVQKRKEAGKL